MSAVHSTSGGYKYIKGNHYNLRYKQDSLDFFYFGCWNKDECKEGNPFSNVLKHIKNSATKYNFGIISGDNIYSDKTKTSEGETIKTFNAQKFMNGVTCLQNIEYPIYSVLGNHDIEKCDIYNLQISNYPYWFLQNYYSLLVHLNGFKVLILFIDTNLFDSTELSDTCYQGLDIDSLKDEMCDWIKKTINKNLDSDHVLVVGHEPLFGFKYKEKKGKIINHTDYQKFEPLFDIFFDYNQKKNKDLYYFSAHLHNCQSIKLTPASSGGENSSILEIISGTGGAEPDSIKEKINQESSLGELRDRKGFSATLLKKYDAYGYISCKFYKNSANINYIHVASI